MSGGFDRDRKPFRSGPRPTTGTGSTSTIGAKAPVGTGSYGPRKPFHSRPASHSRSSAPRGGARRFTGNHIDPNKYINRVTTTEEVEHFVPEHQFADFHIEPMLKSNILTKGYNTPTPIQDKTIPHILQGADVVGIANTGTGKTAAFLIPLINKVLKNPKENILVLVPTRELAIQIDDEFRSFVNKLNMYSVCCVGGASIFFQMKQLRYKNNFVIGTPGRVKDLVDRKCIRLGDFKTLVLDEADRMLDMGFVNDMRFVAKAMPQDRHTLFFSATMNTDIEKLIGEFLKTPVRISVKTRDTSKNVEQDVVRVTPGKNKVDVLHELLSQEEFSKVLIFGRTKHGVEKLSKLLAAKGFKADSIHGDKNHSKRQQALKMFKSNHVTILVATDVAARGLDISDITHVINYDLPATYEDYVHRIGRTGRANKKGKALTFID